MCVVFICVPHKRITLRKFLPEREQTLLFFSNRKGHYIVCFPAVTTHCALASSCSRFLDHTRRATVGRTPLDAWSIRRRDLYLTTHNNHNRQASMPPGGIRTHNLSRRSDANPRLRPRGHWDRQIWPSKYSNIIIYFYTGCPRRNVPDFGKVFLMLKYTDITQNTYVQSWTVTEIMAREKCSLLWGSTHGTVSWQSYPCPSFSVVSYYGNSAHASHKLQMYFLQSDNVVHVVTSLLGSHVKYSAWNPKDNYNMSASVFVVHFNGFMSLTN
jgi:hypothetical protein